MNLKRIIPFISLIGALALLAACGSSGDNSPTQATISGTVFAGPVNGATVKIKASLGNYSTSVSTSPDGTFTAQVPASLLSQEIVLTATGGTYQDEATGSVTPLGSMTAHVAPSSLASGGKIVIDPLSTILQRMIASGKSRSDAENIFSAVFGFSPNTSVKPSFAGMSTASTTEERLAGVRAAAFSQLCNDLGIVAAKQHELLFALADDLMDGSLDGKNGSTPVKTASNTEIPEDIQNQFANALMTFHLDTTRNKSKLKADQIGAPPFAAKAVTNNYLIEYIPVSQPRTGKSQFKLKVTNRSDNSLATGKTIQIRPYMYMSTKSHTTPIDSVVDNGDGTYSCTVYYVMSTAMNGMSMGVWELKVTIDGEVAKFYPIVGMPMGNTALTKLSGVDDTITGMLGEEKRTWFLFYDDLTSSGMNHTFKLFLATKEMVKTGMGTMTSLTFPAVKVNDSLNDKNFDQWIVNSIQIQASTNGTDWVTGNDLGNGHWSFSDLTGLTAGTQGTIRVRLTVNGETKTVDGTASGIDYQTFTVTPGGM
ncbi:MAG: hypothetical protein Fur0034_04790 [Desulfuromonadia bacterium]